MSESHRNLWTTVSQLLLLLLLPLRLELLPLLLELLPLLLLALTPPLLLLRFSSYLPPPAVRERNSWSHAVKSNPKQSRLLGLGGIESPELFLPFSLSTAFVSHLDFRLCCCCKETIQFPE